VVKYKPLWAATFIALVIFVIWALATWLLNWFLARALNPLALW
jgi:hypothetical protein